MEIHHLIRLFMSICFVEGTVLTSVLLDILAPRDTYVTQIRKTSQINAEKDFKNYVVSDFIGIVERYGYSAEEHKVTTDDGYNLLIHRITNSPSLNETRRRKPVVFLQHGLITSSDMWVHQDNPESFAYLLADSGYDIWIGNLRGNTYCRSHVNLTTSDREFWQFSYHENALYDVTKMIDYALAHTSSKNLYYVGHSMGTTIMYAMLSIKPEYNSKIRFGVSLAPIAFWTDDMIKLKSLPPLVTVLRSILEKNNIYNILPQSMLYATVAKFFCSDTSRSQPICALFIKLTFGESDKNLQLNINKYSYYSQYYPAGGASTKLLGHYTQNIKTGMFQLYDYGFIKNTLLYRQGVPLEYDLNKISIPIALYYGLDDTFHSEKSLMKLKNGLQNVVISEGYPFGHMDFILGKQAKEFLYDRILALFKRY